MFIPSFLHHTGALDQQKELYEQKLEELRREKTPDTSGGQSSSGYNSEDRLVNSTPTSFYDRLVFVIVQTFGVTSITEDGKISSPCNSDPILASCHVLVFLENPGLSFRLVVLHVVLFVFSQQLYEESLRRLREEVVRANILVRFVSTFFAFSFCYALFF